MDIISGNMQTETDYNIACNIVVKLFYHINMCIQGDRSKVKLNALEKGIIKGMLGDKVLNGINGYVRNMYPLDVRNLMDDLEVEFKKRRK